MDDDRSGDPVLYLHQSEDHQLFPEDPGAVYQERPFHPDHLPADDQSVLLFICNWLVVGVGFYMLVCSIYPVPASQFLYVAGIDGLSCIIGILAVFTPSGLGVREGIILLGLGLIMPKEYAVIISLVTRLWQTVAEFMLIGIAIVINRGMKFYKKKKEKV